MLKVCLHSELCCFRVVFDAAPSGRDVIVIAGKSPPVSVVSTHNPSPPVECVVFIIVCALCG